MIGSRRNRETGTRVTVYRPGEELCADEGWLTVCEDHGLLCTHPTRRLAEYHAVVPSGWCEGCQKIIKERSEQLKIEVQRRLDDDVLKLIREQADETLAKLVEMHKARLARAELTPVGHVVLGLILDAETAELARRERERAHLEGATS